MSRVFLSSVTEDRPAMRRLAEALRRAGHAPWIDIDWVGVEGTGIDEERSDELAMHDSGEEATELAIERSDALIIGYSAATKRRGSAEHHADAYWTAAVAGKPAFVARFDDAPLPKDLTGVPVFDVRRDSWSRDVEPLIAALARPAPPFVDREAELAWLMRHLATTSSVLVIGEPGVGKSALAAEYARRHAAEYPGGRRVFHSNEVERDGAIAGSRSTSRERSLIIFEHGMNDASTWLDGLSGGASHAIFTARARPAVFPGAVLELGPLSHDDAMRLLERRVGPTDEPTELQARAEIVAAARGVPAALVSAADLHRRGWRLTGGATSITPIITEQAPQGSPERALLEGMLPFAAEAAPLEWVVRVGGAESLTEAAAAARRLEVAGLMNLEPDGDISLHPATREALRAQLAPAAQRAMRARAEEIAASWLTDALSRKVVPDDPRLEHVEALASGDGDDASSPWRAALQERLAALHQRRGDLAQARRLLERAEQITSRHRVAHGDLHVIVAAQLAWVSMELGDPALARRALADAITAAQGRLTDGPSRWRDVDPVAYQEALDAALNTAEALDDPGSEARAAFLLADFHGRRGAWERAAPLAEQALRAARRASEPILVARAYRLLADVALHGSRYEDARASYEEAIRRLDELGAEELAATSRLLYINLLIQLNRREAAARHVERLRGYLHRAPTTWPYQVEAVQTLRLFDESATEGEG